MIPKQSGTLLNFQNKINGDFWIFRDFRKHHGTFRKHFFQTRCGQIKKQKSRNPREIWVVLGFSNFSIKYGTIRKCSNIQNFRTTKQNIEFTVSLQTARVDIGFLILRRFKFFTSGELGPAKPRTQNTHPMSNPESRPTGQTQGS